MKSKELCKELCKEVQKLFDDRRSALEKLFVMLDSAIEHDQVKVAEHTLRVIVDVANQSPLVPLSDPFDKEEES